MKYLPIFLLVFLPFNAMANDEFPRLIDKTQQNEFKNTNASNKKFFNYLCLDLLHWTYTEDVFSRRAQSMGFKLRNGIEFYKYFAIETHLITGGSDTVSLPTTIYGTNTTVTINTSLDLGLSGFVRGNLPLHKIFNIYGLIGYSVLQFSHSARYTLSGSESGLSYGAGAEVKTIENLYFTSEYIQYLNDDINFAGISFGLRYNF